MCVCVCGYGVIFKVTAVSYACKRDPLLGSEAQAEPYRSGRPLLAPDYAGINPSVHGRVLLESSKEVVAPLGPL